MDAWQRRTIGVLTLGGSAVGFTAIIDRVPILEMRGISLVIVGVFAAFFVSGLIIGLFLIEGKKKTLPLAMAFWVAQIPVVSAPFVRYDLFTGTKLDITLSPGLTLNFKWGGGAEFNFNLFQGDSLAIGLNVVAAVIAVLLWRAWKRAF